MTIIKENQIWSNCIEHQFLNTVQRRDVHIYTRFLNFIMNQAPDLELNPVATYKVIGKHNDGESKRRAIAHRDRTYIIEPGNKVSICAIQISKPKYKNRFYVLDERYKDWKSRPQYVAIFIPTGDFIFYETDNRSLPIELQQFKGEKEVIQMSEDFKSYHFRDKRKVTKPNVEALNAWDTIIADVSSDIFKDFNQCN